ncbi:MAG: hypothetical protein H6873_07175 [Hyphomicrobiaceae bacterium]|nr:hypothetical protein [Hyphomicrobiaceae bacterium]
MGKLLQLKRPDKPSRTKPFEELRDDDLGKLLLFTGIRYSRHSGVDHDRLPPTSGNGALKKAPRE